MNIIIDRTWKQGSLVNIEDLRGMTFKAEAQAHTFRISGVDAAGNPITLTGTPSGVMLRPDNTDVVLTCAVSDGKVTATLPAECYDVPGRVGITIYLTSNSQKVCIYSAITSVNRTSSGTASPGTTSSVVDLVNAIEAAIAQIPASDTNLKGALAPTYSDSAVYAVGQYAWYDGKLYKCTTAITTSESWTSGHWTEAKLAQDVTGLKSGINRQFCRLDGIYPVSQSSAHESFYIPKGSTVTIKTKDGSAFQNDVFYGFDSSNVQNNSFTLATSLGNSRTFTVSNSSDVYYYYIVKVGSRSDIGYVLEVNSNYNQEIIDNLNHLLGEYQSAINCDSFQKSGNYRTSTLTGTLPSGFDGTNAILENRTYNGWVIQKIYHLFTPNDGYIRCIQLSSPVYNVWYRITEDNKALASGTNIDNLRLTGNFTVGSPAGTLPTGWSSSASYYLSVEGFGIISSSNETPRYYFQSLRQWSDPSIIKYRMIDSSNNSVGSWMNDQQTYIDNLNGQYTSEINCNTFLTAGNYRVTTLSGTLPDGFSGSNVLLENRVYNGWVIQKIYHLFTPNDEYVRYIQISNPVYTWYKVTNDNASLSSGTNIDNITYTGKFTVNSPGGTLPHGWSDSVSYYLEVKGFGIIGAPNSSPRFIKQELNPFTDPGITAVRIIDTYSSNVGEWSTKVGNGLNGKKIVFFGDSITGNYVPPLDIPSMIAALTGADCYNAGFGGCSMATGAFRTQFSMAAIAKAINENDYSIQEESGVEIAYQQETTSGFVNSGIDYVPDHIDMMENLDWSTVDYAIIFYGTNDFTNARELDNASDKYDTTTYKGAFRYSVEKILSVYPNIKILPITPMWRWYPDADPYIDSDTKVINGHTLHEFAQALEEVAKEYHFPVLDLYYNCGFNKFNKLSYFYANDGTHPKRNGVNVITDKIAHFILNN